MLLEHGKTRIYALVVVGLHQKADVCFMLFSKLYVLMALTRQTMKADRRWLVILSVKDSNGKVTVVVTYIAPNERSCFFRWLFQDALPVLVGAQSLHSVKLIIMTDGDSQENHKQVDFAISTYFVNAVRTRCG